MIGLILLSILPLAASWRLCPPLDFRWLLGYWLVVSIITHVTYRVDKKRAELGQWRTPESTLHFLELIGGWAGAFLAQREFRHKISKGSYQETFWAIVVLYQIVACDFLLGWAITRAAWRLVQNIAALVSAYLA